jgi:hypothetical protein
VSVSIPISALIALFSSTTAHEPGFGSDVVCQAFVTGQPAIYASNAKGLGVFDRPALAQSRIAYSPAPTEYMALTLKLGQHNQSECALRAMTEQIGTGTHRILVIGLPMAALGNISGLWELPGARSALRTRLDRPKGPEA